MHKRTNRLLLVSLLPLAGLPGAPQQRSENQPTQWTIRQAKVIARESLDTGTLVTVGISLNDPDGMKGRTYITPQSPFAMTKSGKVLYWTGWMNSSPRDNQPALWHALTPASIEIEIKRRELGANVVNTRAVKKTDISVKKVSSGRDVHYVDDNSVEVTLYFDARPQDITDVGFVTYKDTCADACRDSGVDVKALNSWKPPSPK